MCTGPSRVLTGSLLAECSEDNPCEGLSRHATFSNFGMAFLTLFRVSTGDNWNGIMKARPRGAGPGAEGGGTGGRARDGDGWVGRWGGAGGRDQGGGGRGGGAGV